MFRVVIVLCVLVALLGCSKTPSPSGLDTLDKTTPNSQTPGAIVEQLDIKTLTDLADTIVVGRVVTVNTRWLDEAKSSIVTEVTVAIEIIAIPQGELYTRVTVLLPGGTLDGVTQATEDSPQFALNERVLVFLNVATDGTYKMAGGSQGKLSIVGSTVQAWEKPLMDVVQEVRTLKAQD